MGRSDLKPQRLNRRAFAPDKSRWLCAAALLLALLCTLPIGFADDEAPAVPPTGGPSAGDAPQPGFGRGRDRFRNRDGNPGEERAPSPVRDAAPAEGTSTPVPRKTPGPVEVPFVPDVEKALSPDDPPPIRAKTRTDAMLKKAHAATFRLRVQTAQREVFVNTTGVFITADGFAVTTFHSLKGAIAAWAEIEGREEPVPLELWVAQPQLDLALVKIDPKKVGDFVPTVMPIAAKDPMVGAESWALGFSKRGQRLISAGAVTDAKPYTKLEAEARSTLNYDDLSHWIITSAPVTIENSGGPLVNAAGELIGLTSWTWPKAQPPTIPGFPRLPGGGPGGFPGGGRGGFPGAMAAAVLPTSYYALSATHIKDLIDPPPAIAITFKKAGTTFGQTAVPHNTLPRIEVTSFGQAAQLQRAINEFNAASICPLCKGEGEVEVEQEEKDKTPTLSNTQLNQNNVGKVNGGKMLQPAANQAGAKNGTTTQQTEYKTCPKCKGTGFSRAESVFKLATNVVLALAALDSDDPAVQPTIAHLETKLLETIDNNPQRMARNINAQARKFLHSTNLPVGTPVVLIGVADTQSPLGASAAKGLLVQLEEFGPTIVIAEPDVSFAKPDGIILVGGVLAGYLDDADGKPVPLIHRGFVINIPRSTANKNTPGPTNALPGANGAGGQNGGQNINGGDVRADAWRRWMEMRSRGFGPGGFPGGRPR
jgi:hypothetical protein